MFLVFRIRVPLDGSMQAIDLSWHYTQIHVELNSCVTGASKDTKTAVTSQTYMVQ